MGSTATSTAATSTSTCRRPGCDRPRATLIHDGRRKQAKTCAKHASPAVAALLASADSKTLVRTKYCGARLTKKSKKRGHDVFCTKEAGWGTDHLGHGQCKLHGGSTRNGKISAMKQEVAEQMPVMGLPIDVDPMEALLQCVRTAAGQVNYCTWRVQQLSEAQATVRYKEKGYTPGEFGGEFSKKTSDERMAIWITAQRNAMSDLARYSKMALDAGVDERQVRIAEDLGGMIGRMIRNILQDLGLNTEQAEQAPEIVRRHLQVIEGKALEAGA